MNKLIAAAVVGFCVLCLASCGGSNAPVDHRVTLAEMGGSEDLQVGQTVTLALPQNASTGYSWKWSWTPEALLSLADDYYVADEPVLTGSGGTRYLVFAASAPGQVVLTAQYGRWWEGGEQDEPHSLTLNIAP